jgi:predicted  nucleic acid-binding Zn-ribbon protein
VDIREGLIGVLQRLHAALCHKMTGLRKVIYADVQVHSAMLEKQLTVVEDIERETKETEKKEKELRAVNSEFQSLSSRIEGLRAQVNNLKVSESNLTTEKASLEQSTQRLIEGKEKALEDNKNAFAAWKAAVAAEEAKQKIEKDKRVADRAYLEKELEDLTKDMDEMNERLGKAIDLRKKRSDLDSKIQTLETEIDARNQKIFELEQKKVLLPSNVLSQRIQECENQIEEFNRSPPAPQQSVFRHPSAATLPSAESLFSPHRPIASTPVPSYSNVAQAAGGMTGGFMGGSGSQGTVYQGLAKLTGSGGRSTSGGEDSGLFSGFGQQSSISQASVSQPEVEVVHETRSGATGWDFNANRRRPARSSQYQRYPTEDTSDSDDNWNVVPSFRGRRGQQLAAKGIPASHDSTPWDHQPWDAESTSQPMPAPSVPGYPTPVLFEVKTKPALKTAEPDGKANNRFRYCCSESPDTIDRTGATRPYSHAEFQNPSQLAKYHFGNYPADTDPFVTFTDDQTKNAAKSVHVTARWGGFEVRGENPSEAGKRKICFVDFGLQTRGRIAPEGRWACLERIEDKLHAITGARQPPLPPVQDWSEGGRQLERDYNCLIWQISIKGK